MSVLYHNIMYCIVLYFCIVGKYIALFMECNHFYHFTQYECGHYDLAERVTDTQTQTHTQRHQDLMEGLTNTQTHTNRHQNLVEGLTGTHTETQTHKRHRIWRRG